MSIKIMSKVWEQSSHEGSPLLLLLALADHASDDGVCWPGIPRLAHKTRKTERHTKRLLVKLEKSGEVYIAREVGRGNTNMYYITLGFDEEEMAHTLIKRFEFDPTKATQVAKQITQLQEKGDAQDTFSDEEEDEKGDIQEQEKVTPGVEKVTPGVEKDDIAMSPESSLTITKPSVKNQEKGTSSENPISKLTTFEQGDDYLDVIQKCAPPGGDHATPACAGGADAAAEAAMWAMYHALDSEAPREGTGDWKEQIEIFSQALRDRGVKDAAIAAKAGRWMGMANLETPHFANPRLASFPAAFGIYVGKAKKAAHEAEDRRDRDQSHAEASQAALAERRAARPAPAEDCCIGKAIKSELELQMTKGTFVTYVQPTQFVQRDGVLLVTAPDAFKRDWLENRLATTIRRTAVGVCGDRVEMEFEAESA